MNLFTNTVNNTRKKISYKTDVTYYPHLNCRHDLNLIWRIDQHEVSDGANEAECWQLEQNVCKAEEYRYINGQCIPEIFVRDNVWYPDCMDGTDEPTLASQQYSKHCREGDPSIRCEEAIC